MPRAHLANTLLSLQFWLFRMLLTVCPLKFISFFWYHRANDTNPIAVIKPPMAKVADVFGRFEAFCISVFIYVLGYVQMAASRNVQTYASAQIFYSAGSTGLQILQQVFIADSSSLLNRALFASLPDLPFLATVWVGPMIADSILQRTTWRWGYAMWIIILPAAFLPLALSLLINQRKAQALHLLKPKAWKGKGVKSILRNAWYQLDLFGLILLSAAVTLILVPLTLAANVKGSWHNSSIITMITVGCVCLIAYPFWESSKRLAPRPLLSLTLLKQRTAVAGCALAFFYFSKLYPDDLSSTSVPYQLIQLQSGVLLLRSTLFLLLSTGCPRPISRHSRPHNPNIRIHVNRGSCSRFFLHQIYGPIPTLCHHRMRSIYCRPHAHALHTQGRNKHFCYSSSPDSGWDRRWSSQRSRPARSPGISKPPGSRGGNSHVSNSARTRWCGGVSSIRRRMDEPDSPKAARIPP